MKYDDFAMPSLENLENMAKAYNKIENKFINDIENKAEDFYVLQNIYNDLFVSLSVLKRITALYPKNRKFMVIYEKTAKLKLLFESEYVNYNLELPNVKVTFSERFVVFDLIKSWTNIINLFLNKIKDIEKSKKFIFYYLELINEIVKY